MNNIDDFNRGVALILSELYQQFPVPYHLNITGIDPHEDLLPEDLVRRKQRINVYASAVVFLKEEGFIRYEERQKSVVIFANVVLTSKGLAALQKMPKQLNTDDRKTIGETLVEINKDIMKDMAKDLLKGMVSGLLMP